MRMKVPKMSWIDFLELSKGLRADPRFALTNQDVENGLVRFRSELRLDLLKDLLIYHNRGIMPYTTVLKSAQTATSMKALGFDFTAWRATLENVRPKGTNNGVDWYVAKCPSCASRGSPDEKGHGLNFSDDGKIRCHRGCSFWDVVGHDKKPESEKEVTE